MSDTPLDFHDLSKASLDEALSLLSESLSDSGATKKTEEFWRWKHAASAFGPSCGVCAKASDGRLIGLRPLMRWQLRTSEGRIVSAFRPVDTVTAPAARGKGLFSRMTMASIRLITSEGDAIVFNTPNAASLPGYLKLGWRRVASLRLYARPTSLLGVCRSLLDRFHPGQGGELVRGAVSSRNGGPNEINQIVEFCAQAEQARASVGLRTVRSESYIRWRFLEHPNVDYSFLIARDRIGNLRAVGVFREQCVFGFRVVLLVDIFSGGGPDRRAWIRKLLFQLCASSRAALVVAHAGLGTDELKVMRRALFIPMRRVVLIAKWIGGESSGSYLDEWDLTLSDLEIF